MYDSFADVIRKCCDRIEKFNPYHDERGRFCSAEKASTITAVSNGKTKLNTINGTLKQTIESALGKFYPNAAKAAAELYTKAVEVEHGITNTLKNVAQATGTELVGLKFRVKTPESIARKIEGKIVSEGKSVKDAVEDMRDVNRYTLSASPKNLVNATKSTIEEMKKNGFECFKKKCTFYEGSEYFGINMGFKNTKGQKVEVQANTPESLKVKEANHLLYEEQRLPSTTDAKKAELGNQMAENLKSVKIPNNISELYEDGFTK